MLNEKLRLETIEFLINEEIDNLFLNEKIRSDTFDWRFFSSLNDRNQIGEYLERTLERADSYKDSNAMGSSRKVFFLSSGKVIKFAKNNAGIAQNEAEVAASTTPSVEQVIADVYDMHSKFYWIVSELVKPVGNNMDRITQYFGANIFPKWDFFSNFALYVWENGGDVPAAMFKYEHQQVPWASYKNPNIGKDIKNPQVIKKITQFFGAILNFVKQTGSRYEDMLDKNHLAVTSDGRIVILDYGFTKEIGKKYYDWHSQSDINAGIQQGYKPNLNAE